MMKKEVVMELFCRDYDSICRYGLRRCLCILFKK